ncbi:MAG: hypothetical protein HY864_16885 [Chloroflexi bacterium]|nr:hypothetical protein [Chloroflexota bacterium]
MNMRLNRNKIFLTALLIGLLSMILLVGTASAQTDLRPAAQTTGISQPVAESTPPPTAAPPEKACVECHPDKHDAWLESPHAHSFDDSVFQEGWANMEYADECLLCHKATYDPNTEQYIAEGVSCEACHGQGSAEHPPAEIPVRSDEEYCGTCHPTTLGEVRLSGHTTPNEVRCVNCHDPHSQKVLFDNPDDMCKSCHSAEDLGEMEESLGKMHLQENIPCVSCHTLDVPHTFLFNYQHEDTSTFFKGFDCTSEVSASVGERTGTSHEALGSFVKDQMNWPVVHRVSRLETAPQCTDCHIMDEKLRADFVALGYTAEELDTIAWENEDFPALTETDLNKLVAAPKRSWSWAYWLVGVAAIIGVFEFTTARKMEGSSKGEKLWGVLSSLRARLTRSKSTKQNDPQGKE